ncbi:hypothetical protein M430DRAFT_27832 [Amorphotheca resinae ATCC 22711]|uniref:Uncharacterized protein n=1 Tax=Amorphotheca resinae ATCC 22711 TaxID=857342 RepID=A0A2T3B1E0_AMORE|nr:hypothetical protein M430DRAFT_27832 [Amorphotheca resinae ATCC 22711]PSS18373.1 hypothetical protein M430DRAFT_27832 [Amorphotheca resinae ATCC 22711]
MQCCPANSNASQNSKPSFHLATLFLIISSYKPIESVHESRNTIDPLTALSVASSVIQFVDFGSKLLSFSRQLYKSKEGVLTENVDVKTITEDITTLVKGLRGKLPEHRGISVLKPSEDGKALDKLCRRCKLKVKKKKSEGKEEEKGKAASRTQVADLNVGPSFALGKPKESILNYGSSINSKLPQAAHFRSGALNDLAVQQSHTSHQLEQSTRLILDTFLNNRDGLANQLSKHGKSAQKINEFLREKLDVVGQLQTTKSLKDSENQDVDNFATTL